MTDNAAFGAARFYLQGDRTKAASYIPIARKHLIQEQMFTMDRRLDMSRRVIRLAADVTMQVLSLGGVNTVVINAIASPVTLAVISPASKWGPWDQGTDIPTWAELAWVCENGTWILAGEDGEGTASAAWKWVTLEEGSFTVSATNTISVPSTWNPMSLHELRALSDCTPAIAGFSFLTGDDFSSYSHYKAGVGPLQWTDGTPGTPPLSGEDPEGEPNIAVDGSDNIHGVATLQQDDGLGNPDSLSLYVDVVKNSTVTRLESVTQGVGSFPFFEGGAIAATSDDRILITYYGDHSGGGTTNLYYRYSDDAGSSWGSRLIITEANLNDDWNWPGSLYAVGKVFFLSNRTTGENKPSFIYTTKDNGSPVWSAEFFPFGEMTTFFSDDDLIITGSADGTKASMINARGIGTISERDKWIALYAVNLNDPDDVTITQIEDAFRLTGNPDFEDPPGVAGDSRTTIVARQVDDGITYVGAFGSGNKFYRRKRSP